MVSREHAGGGRAHREDGIGHVGSHANLDLRRRCFVGVYFSTSSRMVLLTVLFDADLAKSRRILGQDLGFSLR